MNEQAQDEIIVIAAMLRWSIEVLERRYGANRAWPMTSKILEAREELLRIDRDTV